MKAGTLIVGLCFVASACGSAHLSEAAFRAKANGICSRLNKQGNASSPPKTLAAFRKSLARVDSGIRELARLKPPPRYEARYDDFLKRLRRLLDFARAKGPELIALTSQLEKATPKRVGVYPSRRALRRFALLSRKLRELQRSVGGDVRRVDADARALHLPACAAGAAGG